MQNSESMINGYASALAENVKGKSASRGVGIIRSPIHRNDGGSLKLVVLITPTHIVPQSDPAGASRR